jgi:hypothetical protein
MNVVVALLLKKEQNHTETARTSLEMSRITDELKRPGLKLIIYGSLLEMDIQGGFLTYEPIVRNHLPK